MRYSGLRRGWAPVVAVVVWVVRAGHDISGADGRTRADVVGGIVWRECILPVYAHFPDVGSDGTDGSMRANRKRNATKLPLFGGARRTIAILKDPAARRGVSAVGGERPLKRARRRYRPLIESRAEGGLVSLLCIPRNPSGKSAPFADNCGGLHGFGRSVHRGGISMSRCECFASTLPFRNSRCSAGIQEFVFCPWNRRAIAGCTPAWSFGGEVEGSKRSRRAADGNACGHRTRTPSSSGWSPQTSGGLFRLAASAFRDTGARREQ